MNQEKPRTGLWEIFSVFLVMGIQSFGGGSATFFLIHQTCRKRGWMEEDEFIRAWALAQIAPGINLIKLTMLIGRRLRGWPGLIAAASGLILPSGFVTILMTAGFSVIRGQPMVQAAMKGILPATIGLSLAMAVQMGQPLFSQAHREGWARFGLQAVIVASAAVLLAWFAISPVLVLLAGGLITMGLLAWVPLSDKPAIEEKPQ